MNAQSVSTVLEAVADVSAERDLDRLRHGLLHTVTEVLDCSGALFWSLAPCDEEEPAPFEIGVDDALRERLAAGEVIALVAPCGGDVRLYPLSRDEVLAVRTDSARASPEETRVVQAMLRLYMNFADLIAASEQDRLTGLFNRRSFDTQLAKAAQASQLPIHRERSREVFAGEGRYGRWLVLLDVDHFKRINDRFGHLYGDEVLLLLAQLLRRRFRGEDRCFRYGGEEFAVLLAPSDESGALAAVERLRRDVASHVFPRVGQVTISAGCACMAPGLGPLDAIDLADRALYEAKHGGRNRCVLAPSTEDSSNAQCARSFGEVELF